MSNGKFRNQTTNSLVLVRDKVTAKLLLVPLSFGTNAFFVRWSH